MAAPHNRPQGQWASQSAPASRSPPSKAACSPRINVPKCQSCEHSTHDPLLTPAPPPGSSCPHARRRRPAAQPGTSSPGRQTRAPQGPLQPLSHKESAPVLSAGGGQAGVGQQPVLAEQSLKGHGRRRVSVKATMWPLQEKQRGPGCGLTQPLLSPRGPRDPTCQVRRDSTIESCSHPRGRCCGEGH